MRGGAIVIRIVILFLISCAMSVHAAEKFQVGVCTHVGQNKNAIAAVSTALKAANLSFRDEVYWSRIELEKGKLQYPTNLKDIDTLVDATIKNGQQPLLILDYGNAFYDGGGLINSDAGVAAFTKYVQFIVNHFKGRVVQYEIWNEWNIGMGTPTKPRPRGEPVAYVQLLQPTYKAIKAIDPSARVIAGAVSGIEVAWIDSFGRHGGFQYADAFSVHPYVFWHVRSAPNAPILKSLTESALHMLHASIATLAYADSALPNDPGTPENVINALDTLKQQIDQFAPGRDLPIYVTEIGWPTNTGQLGVPDTVAAAYLQRFLLLAHARPWLAGVWWYDLIDDGDDATDKENRFGLLTRTGANKPAYTALLKIKDILASPNPTQIEIGSDEVITATTQLANGTQSKVVWQSSDDFNRSIKWSGADALRKLGFAVSSQTNVITPVPIILLK